MANNKSVSFGSACTSDMFPLVRTLFHARSRGSIATLCNLTGQLTASICPCLPGGQIPAHRAHASMNGLNGLRPTINFASTGTSIQQQDRRLQSLRAFGIRGVCAGIVGTQRAEEIWPTPICAHSEAGAFPVQTAGSSHFGLAYPCFAQRVCHLFASTLVCFGSPGEVNGPGCPILAVILLNHPAYRSTSLVVTFRGSPKSATEWYRSFWISDRLLG